MQQSAPGSSSGCVSGASKIVVPIPVHVSRQFAMRNQNYGGSGGIGGTGGAEKQVFRPPQPNGTLRIGVEENYKSSFTNVK